jgi:3-phenylpropionate/trans-cinnamate dioxygenase ferredoxin subunit
VKRFPVGAVSEFPDRTVKIVKTDSGEIGVVHWGDAFYAVRNICPHEGAELCAGTVKPLVKAGEKLGTLKVDADVPVVACPWHGWEFDARDGKSIFGDPKLRVKSYSVAVEGDEVIIEV